MLGPDILLNFRSRNVADVALAVVEFGDLVSVRIKTDYAVPGFGKAQSQRQTDIAAPDHAYF